MHKKIILCTVALCLLFSYGSAQAKTELSLDPARAEWLKET